jgi:hypothetical protein
MDETKEQKINDAEVAEPHLKKSKHNNPDDDDIQEVFDYSVTKYAPYKIIASNGIGVQIDPNVLINIFEFFKTHFETNKYDNMEMKSDIDSDHLDVLLTQACKWYSIKYAIGPQVWNDAKGWPTVILAAFKWGADKEFLKSLMCQMVNSEWDKDSFTENSDIWNLASIYDKLPKFNNGYNIFITQAFAHCIDKKFTFKPPVDAYSMYNSLVSDMRERELRTMNDHVQRLKKIKKKIIELIVLKN